jgi:hypothetical protein
MMEPNRAALERSLSEAHETIRQTIETIKTSRELLRRLDFASDGWSHRLPPHPSSTPRDGKTNFAVALAVAALLALRRHADNVGGRDGHTDHGEPK